MLLASRTPSGLLVQARLISANQRLTQSPRALLTRARSARQPHLQLAPNVRPQALPTPPLLLECRAPRPLLGLRAPLNTLAPLTPAVYPLTPPAPLAPPPQSSAPLVLPPPPGLMTLSLSGRFLTSRPLTPLTQRQRPAQRAVRCQPLLQSPSRLRTLLKPPEARPLSPPGCHRQRDPQPPLIIHLQDPLAVPQPHLRLHRLVPEARVRSLGLSQDRRL